MQQNMFDSTEAENGAILCRKKNRFLAENSQENLYSLLRCLRDSFVFMPLETVTGEEGESHREPIILEDQNQTLNFAVFTQEEQIPGEMRNNCDMMRVRFVECMQLAHVHGQIRGLILDAFTEPCPLPLVIADLALQMPPQEMEQ